MSDLSPISGEERKSYFVAVRSVNVREQRMLRTVFSLFVRRNC